MPRYATLSHSVFCAAQENIDKKAGPEDWRCREAATSAFGAILEGPSLDKLAQYVAAGLGFLLNAMKDPNQQVRHTTAWTIGARAGQPHRWAWLDSHRSLPSFMGFHVDA